MSYFPDESFDGVIDKGISHSLVFLVKTLSMLWNLVSYMNSIVHNSCTDATLVLQHYYLCFVDAWSRNSWFIDGMVLHLLAYCPYNLSNFLSALSDPQIFPFVLSVVLMLQLVLLRCLQKCVGCIDFNENKFLEICTTVVIGYVSFQNSLIMPFFFFADFWNLEVLICW